MSQHTHDMEVNESAYTHSIQLNQYLSKRKDTPDNLKEVLAL